MMAVAFCGLASGNAGALFLRFAALGTVSEPAATESFTATHCCTASLSSTTIQDAGIPRYCPDLQLRVSFDVHSPLNQKITKKF
jgi:hypothetical protein